MSYSSVFRKQTPMSYTDMLTVGIMPFTDNAYFQSLSGYTINKALREASKLDGEDISKIRRVLKSYDMSEKDIEATINTIQTLDRNMQPLDGDITVTRFVDRDFITTHLGEGKDMSELNDKIIQESGFVSSTYDEKGSLFNTRPVKINLTVKAGTKALFSPIKEEPELLLPRNSSYKVDKISTNSDGNVEINATLL